MRICSEWRNYANPFKKSTLRIRTCTLAESLPDGNNPSHFFGNSVAIGSDIIAVGDAQDSLGSFDYSNAGSVHIFERQNGTWSQTTKLWAPDRKSGAQFGHSVAVSGNTVVVGSPYRSESESHNGTVHVFTKNENVWSAPTKLTPSDPSYYKCFGFSVAIEDDTILVGTHDNTAQTTIAGAAYVFERLGTSWGEVAKLTVDDAVIKARLGQCVSISGDTIFLGALLDDIDGVENAGSVYVFKKEGGTWTECRNYCRRIQQ